MDEKKLGRLRVGAARGWWRFEKNDVDLASAAAFDAWVRDFQVETRETVAKLHPMLPAPQLHVPYRVVKRGHPEVGDGSEKLEPGDTGVFSCMLTGNDDADRDIIFEVVSRLEGFGYLALHPMVGKEAIAGELLVLMRFGRVVDGAIATTRSSLRFVGDNEVDDWMPLDERVELAKRVTGPGGVS